MNNFRASCITGSILLHLVFNIASTTHAAIPLQNATATFSQTSFGGKPVGQAIDGSLGSDNGWAIYEGPTDCCGAIPGSTNPQIAVFETASDISIAGGASLTITLQQLFTSAGHNLGRFRLSATTDARSAFADGLASGGDVTAAWTVLAPLSANSTNGATLTILGDNSILAGGTNPATSTYTVNAFTPLVGITGFRLEVLADSSFPDSGPGRNGNGNFVLTEFQVDANMLSGDYNNNGKVDAADYVLWRKSPGTYGGNPAGYNTWRANFGLPPGSGSAAAVSASAAVPEPTARFLLLSTVAGLSFLRRRAALSSQKVARM